MIFFLVEESAVFDEKIAKYNIELIEASTTYMEEYDGYYSESRNDTFFTKINKFFANIISSLKNFKSEVKVNLEKKIRERELNINLRKMYKELDEKKSWAKEVEVIDCWTLREQYLRCIHELTKYSKKFVNMKYRSVYEIDKDISEFNSIIDNYEKKFDELIKHKIKVPIKDMINFVEDEISGNSSILNSLNDTVTIFEQMKQDVKVLETRRDILGPDILTKHVGFLRNMSNKICNTIKKWCVKIITTIVFIIG